MPPEMRRHARRAKRGWPGQPLSARVERYRCSLQARSYSLQGWGLIDLPLRATFSPAHPLARRDVPLARARAFQSSSPLVKGVAKVALYCAHRTSTVSPCAFCEQEGHLAAPSPSFGGRALREQGRSIRLHPLFLLAVLSSNPYTNSFAIQPGLNSPARSSNS